MATAADPDWQFNHIDSTLPPVMHDVFAATRERCPVVHSDEHGGFWAVLTHDGVLDVMRDAEAYSSASGVGLPKLVQDFRLPPLEFDPPDHARYRRIVQPHFTRQAVARYENVLRELAADRIAELVERGEADLVAGLGRYLPPRLISVILGLPPEDGELFVSWTNDLFMATAVGDTAGRARATGLFTGYLAEQIARQRRDGADTVLTAVASGEVDGEPLTPDEQTGMILLLVLAGHETTVHSIGTMLYHIATVDGLRDRLLADPGLIPGMINETLRIESPAIAGARTVTKETELAGQPLAAGEKVLFVLSSANRDPALFERPDEYVCPREHNPYVTFGTGIHRCIGEHLALLEMRVVAEEILRLAPRYRIDGGFRPEWLTGRMMRGLTSLPVRFDAA